MNGRAWPYNIIEVGKMEIDRLGVENRALTAENASLRAQRDKLLAACEAAWTDYGKTGDISATSLEKMEAAIAAAKERQ